MTRKLSSNSGARRVCGKSHHLDELWSGTTGGLTGGFGVNAALGSPVQLGVGGLSAACVSDGVLPLSFRWSPL